MARFLIMVLLFVAIGTKAQQSITFRSADSITYQCYLTGDWDKLIKTGKQAIEQKIDFKRLHQRMGYAYFVKSDFYASEIQYEKALGFDEFDADTRAYLYYCGLNTGNEAYARFHAEKLPKDLQVKLKEDQFKPVDAIDFEYNYKVSTSNVRSNPMYLRVGIKTLLGYRFSLYQAISNYQQNVDADLTKQSEYFALLDWSATSHTSFDLAYHYLNTNVAGVLYPGNLVFASFSTRLNRFKLGLNGSILNADAINTIQFGLQAGASLPGKSNIYFNSMLSGINEGGNQRMIFSQTAGASLTKMLWAEGSITLGNLLNYNDRNALYVYNSIDQTTFRTGLSLFYYLGKHATLFTNYTYDTKRIEATSINYKQHSFSGGIIWKI